METTKERAARCDRATHARRSSSLPAYGSRTASITRRRRRAKRKALRAATLAAAVLLLGGISVAIFTTPAGSKQETNILPPTTTVGAYIPDTPAPAAETVEPTEPAVRYTLTDAERDVVERVVMAEAGGESFEGQMLVAQCILNAAEKRGVEPSEAVVLYSYSTTGGSESDVLKIYKTVPLLVIDDIGKEPPTEWAISTVYNIINGRYEAYLPTIVTTNYDTEALIDRMTPRESHDSMTARATIDRLMEMCRGITLTGQSWRSR